MKANIDSSFTRRFNAFIEFENPDMKERHQLWKNYLPDNVSLAREIKLNEIAQNYELTGANIVNVIQYAGLQTLKNNGTFIRFNDLFEGIRKEYRKEGKMLRKS